MRFLACLAVLLALALAVPASADVQHSKHQVVYGDGGPPPPPPDDDP